MKTSKTNYILCGILSACIFFPAVAFIIWKTTGNATFLSIFITLFVTSYHFLIRIVLGELGEQISKKHPLSENSFFFKERKIEQKLFYRCKFWKWKKLAITAKPEKFNPSKRSLEELVQSSLWAEQIHAWCTIFSYLPLLFIPWAGAAPVFIITSFFASLIDFYYVLLQRYNRSKLLAAIKRRKKMCKV